MMIMKTIHYNGADYSGMLDYLLLSHDEETKGPVFDRNGCRMARPEIRMDGINCTPSAFPALAEDLNRRYHKNLLPDDHNMIQIILSYDPKDAEEGLLSTKRGHEVSMEFIRNCFPGVLGVAVTHEDGDHHAGNIHTHFVFDTVKYSDEISAVMQCPEHAQKGNKYTASDRTFHEYGVVLEEILQREGLRGDVISKPPLDRISNGEYHVFQDGQRKLEEENRLIIASGGIPKTDRFRTKKQEYRDAVQDAFYRSRDLPKFHEILKQEYGIVVTEYDGKWRYDKEDARGYAASTLGTRYHKDSVLSEIRKNKEEPTRIDWYISYKESQKERQLRELEKNSLEGYRKTLSPPWAENLSGDIGRIVYDIGMALPTKEEQIRYFRPYAEAVRFLDGYRSIEELDHREEGTDRVLSQLDDEYTSISRDFIMKEDLWSYSKTARDYRPLRQKMESSSDPELFRKTHWPELKMLELAEEMLAGEPVKTPEERWEDVRKVLQEKKEMECLRKDLRTELDIIRSIQTALSPIRPTLEKCRAERELRLQKKREEAFREQQAREERAREEKHIIPIDYER